MNRRHTALASEAEPVVLPPARKGQTTRRALEHRSQREENAEAPRQTNDIFADQTNEQARTIRVEIERVARRPFNILITGETGTGKTYAAREIHRLSARSNKPFVELNCANLPEHLVEAELFGYRRGAFTGADRDHTGLFEEADGGILLLAEIGDIRLRSKTNCCVRLKKSRSSGSARTITYFVMYRLSQQLRNLTKMIQSGEFREDLYCRLAVLTMETAPLRDTSHIPTRKPVTVVFGDLLFPPLTLLTGLGLQPEIGWTYLKR